MIDRRSKYWLSAWLASFLSLVVLAFPSNAWAAGIVVSGRVVNTSTGQPIVGVTIATCTVNAPVTDATGRWQILLAAGAGYCARVAGGVPAGLVGPVATGANPDVGAVASYEYQAAGVNCYHNAACVPEQHKWDRVSDGNVDFAFRNAPPVTPVPTPVPPVATPAPAVITHAPVVTVSPSPVPEPTPSATPTASPDPSLTPTAEPTTGPEPTKVGFSTDDKSVGVDVPLSMIPAGATCSIEKVDAQKPPQDRTVIAGAFSLKCVAQDGKSVALTGGDIVWHMQVKDKLGKLTNPEAVVYSDGSSKIITSNYDKNSGIISFSSAAAMEVYVVASPPSYWWINAVVIIGVIVLLGAVILYFPMRVHRRRSYQEYLRSKYYNL